MWEANFKSTDLLKPWEDEVDEQDMKKLEKEFQELSKNKVKNDQQKSEFQEQHEFNQDIVEEEEEDEMEKQIIEQKKMTLMERINKAQNKQVTAKVKGILKMMNKTYGGSILEQNQMTS